MANRLYPRKVVVNSHKPNNFEGHKIIFNNLNWMRYYKEPSFYDQCMTRLRCKIFNDYYEKPMSESLARCADQNLKCKFLERDAYRRNLINRFSSVPFDLDDDKNQNFYTHNPQVRALTFKLREYGLFRDEHLDFNDEMKRSKILRGRYRFWKDGKSRAEKK